MSHYSTLKGLGRAIAYFPQLGIHLGNPLAGIFLSQLIYWHDKTDNELGVYKTSEEWLMETGLTYRQQATARTLLKNLGILSETEKRLEHKLYFKLNIQAFDLWFENCINSDQINMEKESNSRTADDAFPERRIRNSGEYESAIRGDTNAQFVTTENTTKNTTDINTHSNAHAENQNMDSWTPDLEQLAFALKTTKYSQRVSEILGMVDFQFHLGNFNAHHENNHQITNNQKLRKFAQWIFQEFEKQLAKAEREATKTKNHTTEKQNSRNVNDAWGEVQQYAPASDIDCGGLL
ncbi:MAG: hypothetical protein ACN6NV_06995 [Acinetobacter gandensis]|uniref:hypothetical protein n=1 Tax=Acinetobacter gandensis TaxID=1443941 RepID=UPI003D011440